MDDKIQPHPTRSSNSASIEGGRTSPSNDEAKEIRTLPQDRQGPAWELSQMSPEEYRAFEKKTLWKMDLRIIPWITLLYLISFLDRVNIGVARLTGLLVDLNLSSKQYSNASMIFFVSYVAFEVPSNLVLKKFKPSRWIPATMICWALFQTFMGLVKNYESLLALRFCLGIFEAGLFPGLNFFLTGWYRREEINKRVAVFFGGAVLAGAFGGIFGYALSRMAGVGGLNGWQWIFIMEGILTMIIGIASFWMMQDWPDQAKFLTPLEREFVLTRLKREQGPAGEVTFGRRHLKQAFGDWKMWCLMIMYIGAGEPLYSLALFSPTIVASLGTFSIPQSLLLSTPPYVVGFMTTLGTAYLSDKYRRRAPFLMFWSAFATLGYILLMVIPRSSPGAQYFALFMATAGAAPMIATTISWTGNTWGNGNHYKKAITMGMVFSSGNSGGIVASQVYRAENAPRYYPGHGTAVGFCVANFVTAALLWWFLARENKRRDIAYGKPSAVEEQNVDIDSREYIEKWGLEGKSRTEIIELGENHPGYRYVL